MKKQVKPSYDERQYLEQKKIIEKSLGGNACGRRKIGESPKKIGKDFEIRVSAEKKIHRL